MKLHLTATSERGKPITKSGNERLEIEVLDENRQVVLQITLGNIMPSGAIHTHINSIDDVLWVGYLKGKPKTAYTTKKGIQVKVGCEELISDSEYCKLPSVDGRFCKAHKSKTAREDDNWLCVECGKKKEEYEALYCDKCYHELPH